MVYFSSMVELTLQDLRRMGGEAVLKKYGKDWFSKLGKISAARKKENNKTLLVRDKLVLDNG